MADISKITPLGSSTTYDITARALNYAPQITTLEDLNAFGKNEIKFKVAKISALDGHTGTLTKNDGMILAFPWSGGYGHQFYVDDNGYGLHHRYWYTHKVNDVDTVDFNNWVQIIDSNNYTNYTVKKDGTGATGTWGISITGNAATATKATQDSDGNAINTTYLKKSGGAMTGNINRYYSAASTDPMITALANNQDITLFTVGHSTAAGTTTTSNHYKLLYKGTGSSPNNYLQLIAHGSADKVAIQIDENANVSFTNKVTANISGNAETVTVTKTTPTSTTTYYPTYTTSTTTGAQSLRNDTRFYYYDTGTTSYLNIGNTSNSGGLTLHNANGKYGDIVSSAFTANRTFTLPDKTGTFALTSDLNGYLPLSGGTLTGPLYVNSLSKTNYIAIPDNGFWSADGSKTGAIKITLPVSWTATMMSMKVDIYNYDNDNAITYTIGGYNYNGGDGYWTNCSASSTGLGNKANLTVRFGHDGTKCCIIIGETNTSWSYPKAQVRDIMIGHSGTTLANWTTGWTVSLITTLPDNIDVTKSNPAIIPIIHGGTGASTAAAARANLGTWSLISDSYNTLMPADGSTNGWVKIGTSNTSFGLLPSTSGGAGSGHNYIGTSSWYWKYAYIDEIHGTLKGNADTASNDSDGNAINTTYLKRSGGQMTGNITGNSTATIGTTAQPFHQLVLGGATTATMTADSTNPRITFQEGTGTQPVHLIYSDYDSYRSPAGLKIIGGASATPAWLEVEGQIYGARFNGPVTGDVTGNATSANYVNLYEARGTTTTLNKSANYVGAGKMFHLVASSSTSATDNGKTATDANILQMNWDNNGGYDSQFGISASGNRSYFRSQASAKTAWREYAHIAMNTKTGDATIPVYVTADGKVTAVSSNSVLTNLASTSGASIYSATPRPGITGTLGVANGGTGETTALNAFNALASRGGATDLNNALDKGIYSYSNSTTNTPVATRYGAVLNIINNGASHNNSNNWIWQYTTDTSSNNLYIRRKVNNGAWTGWTTFLNSDNYTSYTVKKDGTGASGTWGISITGNAATATKLVNARTISLTGSVTGSGSFDGSGNLSITTTTNHTHSDYIPKSIGTTKGDIIYWSAANTPARLAIGANGKVLKVVSGVPAWGDVSIPYGETLPSTGTNGDVFLQTSAEYYELPAGGTTGQVLAKSSNADRAVQWVSSINISPSSAKFYPAGSTVATTNSNPQVFNTAIYVENNVLFGAAWNDYAEYRESLNNINIQSGRCVVENGDDTIKVSIHRMEPGASIVSDTYGFAIGKTEIANLPIAVSGRVLAYPYEDKEEFKKNIGKPVCSGPNGTVSIMTDEEYRNYGYCAIGTISSVPDYDVWGENNIKVNGRVWIKVR